MKRILYILGQLSDQDIDWLIKKGSARIVSTGQVVIEQGQPVEELSIILSGYMKVKNESKDIVVAHIGSGEILGEMSLVDAQTPSVSVIAEENCKIYTISIDRIKQKMEVDLGFAARMYCAIATFLSSRLRSTTSRLGYGTAQNEVDEIDMNVLSEVGQAGARFTRLLQRFSEI